MYGAGYDAELEQLAMLACKWGAEILFTATAQEMGRDLCLLAAQQTLPVDELMRRCGALQGLLAAQEQWLTTEAERLVAQGRAEWV